MSRYSLSPLKEGTKVDVGYDPWIDSYFFQLRVPEGRNFKVARWIGHGIGNCSVSDGSVESIPEKVIEAVAQHAEIPTGLLEALIADRHPEPELVASEPVVYAGWPNGQVWRNRPSVDPTGGHQLVVKPAKYINHERHIGFAILKDFLGHEDRAKRLAEDFGKLVLRGLPEKRNWLLTEVDVQIGVRDVEAQNGLYWLADGKCYLGDCKVNAVRPEAQLKRAEKVRRLRQSRLKSALIAA
ncbi:MAG: hypothetical protein WA354_11315 [Terracidiphilus sp.]